MGPLALHRWQYADYGDFHQTKRGLWIHLFAVPLVWLGTIATIGLPIFLSFAIEVLRQVNGDDTLGRSVWLPIFGFLLGLVVVAIGMALQGKAHKQEPNPPKPFTGKGNALARILVEQWMTFPRFVLSGSWLRQLRQT